MAAANRLLVGLALAALALPARAADDGLCPVADDRRHRTARHQHVADPLTAPESPQETAALRAALAGADGLPRTVAVIRLALGGDVETFRALLGRADLAGLSAYASSYLNQDGTECLDPVLEDALLAHLTDPELGQRLVALLQRNTYRSPAVLAALRGIPFDAGHADRWARFSRALTATRLAGIEPDVLSHARGLLPFDTPVRKRVLPGLHRGYVGFFVARGYAPAVPYLRELLAAASREEPLQHFQIEYGMLRTVVQKGLAALGGAAAEAALVAELDAVAARPLDAFSAAELQTIAALVPSLAESRSRNSVADAFDRLLATPQPPTHDYRMRQVIYEALEGIGSRRAGAVLVAELSRYTGPEPPPNRSAQLPRLMSALGGLRALDFQALPPLADRLESPFERRLLWDVAVRHPGGRSIDFLLDELRLSLTGGPAAEERQGADAGTRLLRLLTAIEGDHNRRRVRTGLDNLFDAGALPEREYGRASAELNRALGDETPRFAAYRARKARQQADEREAATRQARLSVQAQYEAELARQSSDRNIADNVAQLAASGEAARRAARWLVLVGEPALPGLHAALTGASATDRQKVQLINVIGEIGSARSTDTLIGAARGRADGALHRPVFFALALLPPRAEAVHFARAQLREGVPERRQSAALVYLARVRHSTGEALVREYQATGSPGVRAAALYLGARLGLDGMAEAAGGALADAAARGEREALLIALAEAAPDVAAFDAFTRAAGYADDSAPVRQHRAYCAFRTAAAEARDGLAHVLLEGSETWYRRAAIRHLIAAAPHRTVQRLTGGVGQYLPLDQLLALSGTLELLFSESRRLGYRLVLGEQGYVLARI